MPEGPEIRRAADLIARVVVGQALESVEFFLPHLKGAEHTLCGTCVTEVATRGKAMLIHFANGSTLYSHNQLYGKWVVTPDRQRPRTGRALRVALHTPAGSALLYSATDIRLLPTDQVGDHPFIAQLGPDVLSDALSGDLDWRAVADRLRTPRFAGRSLAALYLDQRCLAGIGNYLRSEILYAAALGPNRKPGLLTRGELGGLARATLAVTARSYRTGGVTNRPATVSTLKRRGASYREYRFAVFERDDQPCYRCSSRIQRIDANSRRLYFCPKCQR